MEDNGVLHPLEIKKTTNPATELVGTFKLLYKASLPCGNGAIVCLRETLSAIDRINLIIPAWMIAFFLFPGKVWGKEIAKSQGFS